jgi:hypothetical protein
MHHVRAVILVALLSSLPHPAIGIPSAGHDRWDRPLGTVLGDATQAVGGEDSLRGLRDLLIDAEWDEGGLQFRGLYRATRDGRMRIDVFTRGERVFSEGIDASGAWEQAGPDSTVQAVGDASGRALRHGIEYRFYNIWLAHERGNRVETAGYESIDGIRYYVAKLRLADGFETLVFIHPQTHLIERQRDVRAYHPSDDETKIVVESVRSDFTEHCGVMIPMVSADRDIRAGRVLATQRVRVVQCNLAEAALDLDRPLREGLIVP